MFTCMMPMRVSAEKTAVIEYDPYIYAGGVYDIYAKLLENGKDVSAGATYQWQGAYDYDSPDGWLDLSAVNRAPSVTDSHYRYITAPDFITGDGSFAGSIFLRCRITSGGQVYYTPNLKMLIYPYELYRSTYLSEIAEGRSGLSVPVISGASDMQNFGDTYTATAESQKQLNLSIDAIPCQAEGAKYSEQRIVADIVVTENGKTKIGTSGMIYTPITVGKDAVKVEYRLHVYLGENDCGIFQTKTVLITTYSPKGEVDAVTKRDTSLKKEMYNESQTLATIPQYTVLGDVVQASSLWYKVTYKGQTGFVSYDSITLNSKLPSASIEITPPEAGKNPDFSPVSLDAPLEHTFYHTAPVQWADETDGGKLMGRDSVFILGHRYTVSIWIWAGDGYEFSLDESAKPNIKATLNGREAKANRAYEQDPKKVIEIYYDFGILDESAHKHSLVTVARVEPQCTVAGHEAYYHCSGCGLDFSDSSASTEIDPSVWGVIPAKGHTPADTWSYNGTHHYIKCKDCYEIIPGSTAPHTGGTSSCIEKAVCVVCGFPYGTPDGPHSWGTEWLYKDASGHAHYCDNCGKVGEIVPHTPGPEATATEPQVCLDCGYIITPVSGHVHDLYLVPQVDPTCEKPGVIAYYKCTGCSEAFYDAAGTNKIPDTMGLAIGSLGHKPSDEWEYDENTHWKVCSRCGKIIQETRLEHSFDEGICTECGYKKDTPAAPVTDAPAPVEDNPSGGLKPGLWLLGPIAAVIAVAVLIIIIVTGKKKDKKDK